MLDISETQQELQEVEEPEEQVLQKENQSSGFAPLLVQFNRWIAPAVVSALNPIIKQFESDDEQDVSKNLGYENSNHGFNPLVPADEIGIQQESDPQDILEEDVSVPASEPAAPVVVTQEEDVSQGVSASTGSLLDAEDEPDALPKEENVPEYTLSKQQDTTDEPGNLGVQKPRQSFVSRVFSGDERDVFEVVEGLIEEEVSSERVAPREQVSYGTPTTSAYADVWYEDEKFFIGCIRCMVRVLIDNIRTSIQE